MNLQDELTLRSLIPEMKWISRSQLNFEFVTRFSTTKNRKSISFYNFGPQKLERAGETLSFKTKFVPIRPLVLKCELSQFSAFFGLKLQVNLRTRRRKSGKFKTKV